jgi:hypothetical protein
MTPALWIALGCFALATILAFALARGAKDDVPVSSAPVDQANETYPRLRAVSALRDGEPWVGGDRDYTPPTLTGRAAKGFNRDACIGRDVVSRAEREWTQPVKRSEMH